MENNATSSSNNLSNIKVSVLNNDQPDEQLALLVVIFEPNTKLVHPFLALNFTRQVRKSTLGGHHLRPLTFDMPLCVSGDCCSAIVF